MAKPIDQLNALVSAEFPLQRFIALALSKLLREAHPDWLQEVLDEVSPPQISFAWNDYKGIPLTKFLGLDRFQIKTAFSFADDDVDEIYSKLNVTEESDAKDNTSVPVPPITEQSDVPQSEKVELMPFAEIDPADITAPPESVKLEDTSKPVKGTKSVK